MRLRNIFHILFFCATTAFAVTPSKAYESSNTPILIEMFSMPGCSADRDIQDSIHDIVEQNENVILLNCPQDFNIDGLEKPTHFTHHFCTERANYYGSHYAFWNMQALSVYINAHISANTDDIEPAISMARADKIADITLKKTNNTLHISIPEITDYNFGTLMLYAYLPSRGKEKFFVDPDVEFTDEMAVKVATLQSVPFVTRKTVSDISMRPVWEAKTLGHWYGHMTQINYPLGGVTRFAQDDAKNLSYVVVLHDKHKFGKVIAAGEVMSSAELANLLPNSHPIEIEFSSVGVK